MDIENQNQAYQIPSQQMEAIDLSTKEDKVGDVLLNLNPRLGFIKKVYGIISFQLAITVILCVISMSSQTFARFQAENPALLVICAFFSLIISFGLICFAKCSRRVPYNYIALITFTLCEAYMVSTICAFTDAKIVIMAAVMTLGVTVALTLYAWTTKSDFTGFFGFMFVSVSALILAFVFFLFDYSALHIFVCFLGVIVYGIYLIYDTQLIMGGKHVELGYDDYIVGALIIYLDIIVLFLRILEILNALKK